MKALLVAASMAASQPTLPTRDITIVYQPQGEARAIIPGGVNGPIRVQWSAGRQALRVEPQGRAQSLLVDVPAARVMVIDSGLHSAMALPVRARDLDPLLLREVQLKPVGRATIAGRACTNYAVESRRGHGTVCLTEDGVALRAEGEVDGKQGSLLALSVSDGPVPAKAFDVPTGFMQWALPRLGQFR